MRIAAVTAWRHTGSLERAIRRRRASPTSFSFSGRNSRPVSIKAQVEALTNSEPEWPIWLCQSAAAILSRISLSTVSASGMRNSASARHISATPSGEDSAYSCRKASSPPLPSRSRRTSATSRRAVAAMRSRASAGRSAAARMAATAASSSRRVASPIAGRSGVCGGRSATMSSMRLKLGGGATVGKLAEIPARDDDVAGIVAGDLLGPGKGRFAGRRGGIAGALTERVEARCQVAQLLGDDVDHAFLALQRAAAIQEGGAEGGAAEAFEDIGPDDQIGDPGLVLDRDEDDAIGAARP